MKTPCDNCIVLAACKQKTEFKCDILFNFMEKSIVYNEHDKVVKGSPSDMIWETLNSHFQREEEDIEFYGKDPNLTGNYKIMSKSYFRDKHRWTHE